MKKPMRVAVTGAAGQIGYSLLFRIASGEMLGEGPARHPPAARDPRREGAEGAEGRDDGARRLRLPAAAVDGRGRRTRRSRSRTSTSRCSWARARAAPAWSARTCSEANGAIFVPQGKALDEVASRDVKVLVVGNPANTELRSSR